MAYVRVRIRVGLCVKLSVSVSYYQGSHLEHKGGALQYWLEMVSVCNLDEAHVSAHWGMGLQIKLRRSSCVSVTQE